MAISCKKTEHADDAKLKKYDVTFNLTDFTKDVSPLSTKKAVNGVGDTLSNYANYLTYYVYKSNGDYYHMKTGSVQSASIADQLPAGTYKIFLCASKGLIYSPSESSKYETATVPPQAPNSTWNDIFMKTVDLTVTNAAITQSIKLDRVVGGLQVNIQDALQSGTTSVEVTVLNEWPSIQINGQAITSTGSPMTSSFAVSASEIGKTKTCLLYVANTNTATSVNIKAYDKNRVVLAEKTINDVRVYKNQKTTLSGNLATISNFPAGFNITVNPVWDTPTSPIIPFKLN